MEVYTTEEQQVEVIKNWWKENGTSVIAGTVIGLVGLFGWRYYNEHQQTTQEAASQAYNEMSAQLAKGDAAGFEQAQSFISAHKGDSYAELAALQLAAAAVKADKLDLAAEQLTQVATSGDESIRPIAALRLARVLNDQARPTKRWPSLARSTTTPSRPRWLKCAATSCKSRARAKRLAMPIRRRPMPAVCRAAPSSS